MIGMHTFSVLQPGIISKTAAYTTHIFNSLNQPKQNFHFLKSS